MVVIVVDEKVSVLCESVDVKVVVVNTVEVCETTGGVMVEVGVTLLVDCTFWVVVRVTAVVGTCVVDFEPKAVRHRECTVVAWDLSAKQINRTIVD